MALKPTDLNNGAKTHSATHSKEFYAAMKAVQNIFDTPNKPKHHVKKKVVVEVPQPAAKKKKR